MAKANTPNSPYLFALADLSVLAALYPLGYWVAQTISESILGRDFASLISHHSTYWLWIYVIQSCTCIILFASNSHYSRRTPWWEQVRNIIGICLSMLLLAGFAMYSMKLPFSRLWLLCVWIAAIPLLIVGRLIVRRICIQLNQWGSDVIIVGGRENVIESLYALISDRYNLYRIKRIYLIGGNTLISVDDLPQSLRHTPQDIIPSQSILSLLEANDHDMMIIAPDEHTALDIQTIISAAHQHNIDAAFVPPMGGLSMYGTETQHFFGSHTVLLKPKRPVESPLNKSLKRTLDILGALAGIAALMIPMLFVIYKIKKDGGPAIYSQMRVGYQGKLFKCYKFRSMVLKSKEILENLLASDPAAKAEWDATFKLKNDPRITKIGHFIRKTSLDELPQLWNVLKGDMSLVGPRPIVEEELKYYGKNADEYLSAKPGLTGLWQVSGRNDVSYAYRVYLDRWYVTHWSLWIDLVIIIRTLGIMLTRSGAY